MSEIMEPFTSKMKVTSSHKLRSQLKIYIRFKHEIKLKLMNNGCTVNHVTSGSPQVAPMGATYGGYLNSRLIVLNFRF